MTDIPRIVIVNNLDGTFGVRTIIQPAHHKTVYEAMADHEIGPFACQEVAEHFAAEITAARAIPQLAGLASPVMQAIRRAVLARNATSLAQALQPALNARAAA